jgi:Ser/Thr protein kinase RdoA (MazF antagonist)
VVKRLSAPVRGDPAALSNPRHAAWWRREADVALDGGLAATAGLRAPHVLRVEEDETGITIWSARVPLEGSNGLHLARALGIFAGNDLSEQPWWCRDVLADRLSRLEDKVGWPTLARTTLADIADRLWQRRGHHLGQLGAVRQVPSHGDPTPANLPGRDGADVVGVDWSSFGAGPVGADLGYLALSVREDLDALLTAYNDGLAAGGLDVDPAEARAGATVMACYTALTRAEWALARAAAGPGALAGKYRHPAVAPYLRSLQRLFPQLETLI